MPYTFKMGVFLAGVLYVYVLRKSQIVLYFQSYAPRSSLSHVFLLRSVRAHNAIVAGRSLGLLLSRGCCGAVKVVITALTFLFKARDLSEKTFKAHFHVVPRAHHKLHLSVSSFLLRVLLAELS